MSIPLGVKRPFMAAGPLGLALLGMVPLGFLITQSMPVAMVALAIALVAFAMRSVETLSVVLFWTLPYMSFNLPTGSFTLKPCDGVAYLFAIAWATRALLRRDHIVFPPATLQVLIFLAALALSAICSPLIPTINASGISSTNRNSPDLRSISLIIWLGVSWLFVTALYNVAGNNPDLYRRCIRAHILSSGLACLISLVMYAMGLFGMRFQEIAGGRSLIFDAGSFLRLAGVAYEPLFLGFYLISVIPVTLAVRSFYPEWLPLPLTNLALALQVTAMVLTFSSGGWAGLLFALLILAFLLRPRVLRPRVIISVVVAAVLFICVCVSFPKIVSIINDTTIKITNGGDDIRKKEWKVGYGLIADYPVFGVGPGMARFYFTRYHDQLREFPSDIDHEVNNVYINTLAEDGVVGFVAFLWCAAVGIIRLILPIYGMGPKRVPLLCALVASLFGIAAQYNSLNSLFLVYFPALIGLACVGARVASSGIEQPVQKMEAVSLEMQHA